MFGMSPCSSAISTVRSKTSSALANWECCMYVSPNEWRADALRERSSSRSARRRTSPRIRAASGHRPCWARAARPLPRMLDLQVFGLEHAPGGRVPGRQVSVDVQVTARAARRTRTQGPSRARHELVEDEAVGADRLEKPSLDEAAD